MGSLLEESCSSHREGLQSLEKAQYWAAWWCYDVPGQDASRSLMAGYGRLLQESEERLEECSCRRSVIGDRYWRFHRIP